MSPMTPQDFISAWTAITGESWRIVPPAVHADAKLAAEAGFAAEDIRVWYAYVKSEIRRPRAILDDHSLLWRVNAANGWQKFQDRLHLGRLAQKRMARPARPENVVPMPEQDEEAIRAESRALLERFRKEMGA